MCKTFQSDAGASDETGMMLSTLAQRELEAAVGHMDKMMHSGDEADAFGHFIMMLTALKALRTELF
ncbi:MAG TPA: hypothetical protein PKK48_08025 [Phycisphaerae bacterium]|nr:hypothetical protein [Phycisphaerae bacterium]HPS52822.1 hypothetical protein [Phycisphaerae bacterium]